MLQAEVPFLEHGSLVLPLQQQKHLQFSLLLGIAELPTALKPRRESQQLHWLHGLVLVSVQLSELPLQKP